MDAEIGGLQIGAAAGQGRVLELKEAEGRNKGALSTKPDVVTKRLLFNAATLPNQVKILAAACDNAGVLDKSVVQT